MKFKIGDEVVITEVGRGKWPLNKYGTGVGKVIEIIGPNDISNFVCAVQWNGGQWAYYRGIDLEHTNLSLENV